jgi:CubicO group peptidase (beta-lactamase class C family)
MRPAITAAGVAAVLVGLAAVVGGGCRGGQGEVGGGDEPPRAEVADAQELADAARALIARHKVASVGYGRVVDGRVTLAGAVGVQSPGVEATGATLYNVASLTKPITAEVVVRLVQEGRLGLDEPMARSWVDPDVVGDERVAKLTPRLALSHQLGFANWRRQTGGKLRFTRDPGTGFGYSGEGYEYVARCASRACGEGFEALAARLVLEPAGMTSTSFTERAWFAGRVAAGFDEDGRVVDVRPGREACAADDVYTTAEDYARFLAWWLRGDGVDAALRAEQTRMQVVTGEEPGGKGTRSGMGLGWFVHEVNGTTYLMHTGVDKGCFTMAVLCPSSGRGQVVLTNSTHGAKVALGMLEMLGTDPAFTAYLRATAR